MSVNTALGEGGERIVRAWQSGIVLKTISQKFSKQDTLPLKPAMGLISKVMER